MATKEIAVPKTYHIYLEYLANLKKFYEIIGNTQYQHKILPTGEILYKDLKAKQWTLIKPPDFQNRNEVVKQLTEKKQKLMANLQDIQMNVFSGDPSLIKSTDIERYNQYIKQTQQIDAQIAKLQAYDIGDIEDHILEFKSQQKTLLKILNDLLTTRHVNYTYDGETDEQKSYQKWYAEWKTSNNYVEWKKANELYYQQLMELTKLNQKITEYATLHQKLEAFSQYHMIDLPKVEVISDQDAKILMETSEKVLAKGKIITEETHVCEPEKGFAKKPGYVCKTLTGNWVLASGATGKKFLSQHTLDELTFSEGTDPTPYLPLVKTKPAKPAKLVEAEIKVAKCNPEHKSATTPGYVCNTGTGNWVLVTGAAGKKLMSEYTLEELTFSKGTDIEPLKPLIKPSKLPAEKPKIAIEPKIAIAEKPKIAIEPKIAIAEKPKIAIKPKAKTESEKPEEKQIQGLSKKAQYSAIIKKIAKETGKTDVIDKINYDNVNPVIQSLFDNKISDDYPAVRTFLSQLNKNKNPAYMKLSETNIVSQTLSSIITKIYKEIKQLEKK